MDIQTINTPEKLHQAIVKFLESDYSHEDLVKMYDDARKCVIRFWGDYSALPALPAYNDNPLDGLQDVMDWCIKSSEVVDDIVFNLERQIISAIIIQLKKLRDFPSRLLSWVNSKLLEQAKNKARAICRQEDTQLPPLLEKAQKESRAELDKIPLLLQAKIASKLALDALLRPEETEAVRIYLSKDPTFNDRLSQLNNEINEVLETLNKLADSKTPTGKLLDIFCKLKDIPLQRQFSDVGYAYSPIDLADVIFGNCNRLYTSIDNVIKTFEEIQTKAQQKTTESGPQEKKNHDGKVKDAHRPAETEQNAAAKTINIRKFQGILGDVQAENVQTGDLTTMKKHIATKKPAETNQNTNPPKWWRRIIKWIFNKTSHLIGSIVIAIIATLVATIVIDILYDFGLITIIKGFIYNLWSK